jgi:hypothetical protein
MSKGLPDQPCPDCGARSAAVGYHGHGMHCRRYYRQQHYS